MDKNQCRIKLQAKYLPCSMAENRYKKTKVKLFGTNLETQVREAYTVMLSADKEYPYLVSARNFIPGILEFDHGEQRYLAFNRFRRSMYEQFDITSYPSACGLGSRDSSYTLIFTRSKIPMRVLGNPLQTEAFLYPEQYGKPQFTRAAVIEQDIIISGTASIRGSETLHPDDLEKQFLVTLENIKVIKEQSGIACHDLLYNIYVKHHSHMESVQQMCQQHGLTGNFYCVDICRNDLLLEIECFSPVFDFI